MSARILVVDNHLLFADALRSLLIREGRYSVVAIARSAAEAIRLADETRPDLVLLDICMPGGSGIGAIAHISLICKVMVVSMYDDVSYVRHALDLGASGYALKESSGAEILSAISDVLAGNMYVPPRLRGTMLTRRRYRQRISATLSRREAQVLRMLCLGQTTQEIAQELGLSDRTVETYRARLRTKIDAKSRAELVAYALEHGLA